MARRKLPYREGTCFVFPLRDVGCARGVIARMDGRGRIFCYFFSPRLSSIEAARIDDLRPQKAILMGEVGDLGLLEGTWIVIGQVALWNREEWPVPPLIRFDKKADRAWLSHYDDKLHCIRDEEVDPSLIGQYPEDGTMGYVAAEIAVTRLLSVTKPG